MSEPKIATPAVGRHLWYFPFVSEAMETGPRAAVVAKVHGDRSVNLAVFDQNGVSHARTSVQLVQPGDKVPNSAYCILPSEHVRREQEAKAKADADAAVAAEVARLRSLEESRA